METLTTFVIFLLLIAVVAVPQWRQAAGRVPQEGRCEAENGGFGDE